MVTGGPGAARPAHLDPYYADDAVAVYHADCLDVLAALPEGCIDAVVTDPPYGLEFHGCAWDGADGFRRSLNPADVGRDNVFGRVSKTFPEYQTTGRAAAGMATTGYSDGGRRLARLSHLGSLNPRCRSCGRWQRGANPCTCPNPDFPNERAPRLQAFQAWCEQWALECLRVLKPGGHLLAFGGSRTWHRLACAVEDAGFEIRDSIGYGSGVLAWTYGSGFPKSLNVSRDTRFCQCPPGLCDTVTDDAAQAAAEALLAALRATGGAELAAAATLHGVRVDAHPGDAAAGPGHGRPGAWGGWPRCPGCGKPRIAPGLGTALKPAWEPIVVARKPLAGTVAGNVAAHGTGALNVDACRTPADQEYRDKCASVAGLDSSRTRAVYGQWTGVRGDSAHPAGRWPTNVVLDAAAAAELDRRSAPAAGGRGGEGGEPGPSRFFPVFRYEAKAPSHQRPQTGEVAHPTVKPLDLIRWLVRLVTPPGGLVLDPFAGSGTTAEACAAEGFRCLTVEREAAYLPLIQARLSKPIQPALFPDVAGQAGQPFG